MAAKTKKKRQAQSPYASQIAAESTLRFNPELSALQQALADVGAERAGDISAAHSAAAGAIQTAKQAAPQVSQVSSDALGMVDRAIAGTVGASDDQQRTRTRLAERLSLAKLGLVDRQTRAAEGEQYAVNAATARASANRSKIAARLQALGVEQGAYASGRAGELAGDDADRQLQADIANANNTTSLLTAGVDETGAIRPGGPKDPEANGDAQRQREKDAAARAKTLASPDDHQVAAQTIQQAAAVAKQLLKGGLSRHEAAQVLLTGRPGSSGQPVYADDGQGHQDRVLNPDGTQQETGGTPEIPAVKPLWASIALDLAYDGGVSANNVRRLHNPQKRYSVNELGLPTQHQRSSTDRRASKNATALAIGVAKVKNVTGSLGR
jgi:hypothetical protein